MTDAVPPSPLASPEAWNLVAAAYAVETVPIFEVFSRAALGLAGVTEGARIVDVAAGPGTLTILAARDGAKVSAIDFAPEMVASLRARVEREGISDIDAQVGDGMDLPFRDASFDAGFSMFGLMFFPDRHRGFRELHRVLVPGAKAVVASWVDFQRVPALMAIFGALAELGPQPATPAPRRPMPLIDQSSCISEMSAGGFEEVEVREVVGTADYASTEAMLDSMARTSAPIVLTRRALGDAWPALEAKWKARVIDRFGAGPLSMPMPANLIVGTRR